VIWWLGPGASSSNTAKKLLAESMDKCSPDIRTSWSVDTLTRFIIASGPSLTVEDVNAIRNQPTIAINDNYLLAPWADVLYACDVCWWDWHAEGLKSFKGRKITQDKEAAEKYGLEYIRSVDADGLSRDPSCIHKGSNSGIQAINLAYHLGARRIVLLGFDMQATGGKTHWHGKHPGESADYGPWHKWLWRYQLVADDAKRMGLEIVNASRETALTCFPRVPLSSLLPVQA
jgi:hypothetical protein